MLWCPRLTEPPLTRGTGVNHLVSVANQVKGLAVSVSLGHLESELLKSAQAGQGHTRLLSWDSVEGMSLASLVMGS